MASNALTQIGPAPHGPSPAPHTLSWPVRVLVIIATVRCLGALLMATPFGPITNRDDIIAAWVGAVPGVIGAALMFLCSNRHNRTNYIGVALLLCAVNSGRAPLQSLVQVFPNLQPLTYASVWVFLPYFIGRGLLEFPHRRSSEATRWLSRAVTLSSVIGAIHLLTYAMRAVLPPEQQPYWQRLITGDVDRRMAGLVLYFQAIIIIALGFVSAGPLLPEDRRRYHRIAWAWGVTGLFMTMRVTTYLYAGWDQLIPANASGIWQWNAEVINAGIAISPLLVVWAGLKDRGWLVKVGLRRLLLVALQRTTLTAAALLPLFSVAVYVAARRDESVVTVFSRPVLAWLFVSILASVLLAMRTEAMRWISQHVLEDHYDPTETAFALATSLRNAQTVDEFAAHLTSGIDRALRPYRVIVLMLDATGQQFVPLLGTGEALAANSVIAEIAAAGTGVLDTPLGDTDSPMRWLPQNERYWLADCGARLIVPMRSAGHRLVGLIALSDKQNGHRYSDDDRRWLVSVAGSASLTMDARTDSLADTGRETTSAAQPWHIGMVARHPPAHECSSCGRVGGGQVNMCPECGSACTTALVPHTLLGKFQFERRIGKGGMGVVYRAHDIALDRPVAVKMLPGTTPEHAERLRQEARAMAAVTHRHLAVVYGVEAWRGQPLLFCEFMEHGTLADRQKSGAMSPREALAIGVAIADATQALHDRQLLHRDIKPSNIGFDRTGVPKLLDFGLAHLTATETGDGSIDGSTAAGTPLYMSPEALHGHAPGTAVDLWSLHVLLYEILAGTHPFRRGSTDETMHAILHDAAPPLVLNSTPTSHLGGRLQFYFASALHKDPGRRPRTAADVANALRAMGH